MAVKNANGYLGFLFQSSHIIERFSKLIHVCILSRINIQYKHYTLFHAIALPSKDYNTTCLCNGHTQGREGEGKKYRKATYNSDFWHRREAQAYFVWCTLQRCFNVSLLPCVLVFFFVLNSCLFILGLNLKTSVSGKLLFLFTLLLKKPKQSLQYGYEERDYVTRTQ